MRGLLAELTTPVPVSEELHDELVAQWQCGSIRIYHDQVGGYIYRPIQTVTYSVLSSSSKISGWTKTYEYRWPVRIRSLRDLWKMIVHGMDAVREEPAGDQP